MPDGGFVPIDYDDLFHLRELIDVMREAGMTHGEFLNNQPVGDALLEVADNIEAAHKRHWMPDPNFVDVPEIEQDAHEHSFDVDGDAANEEVYVHIEPDVA